MKDVFTKIRYLRELYQYKAVDVASILGVTRQTYYKYEKCLLIPTLQELYQLSLYYKISIYYFLRPEFDIDNDLFLGSLDMQDLFYFFDIEMTQALEACKLSRLETKRQSMESYRNKTWYEKTEALQKLQDTCRQKKKYLKIIKEKVLFYMNASLEELKQEHIDKRIALEGKRHG